MFRMRVSRLGQGDVGVALSGVSHACSRCCEFLEFRNYNCRCDTLLVVLRRVCVLWILAVRFLATATAYKLRMLYYIFVGNGTCVVGCPIGL